MKKIFLGVYPKAKNTDSPAKQMEAALKRAGSGNVSGSGLLELIVKIAPAVKNEKSLSLHSARFKGNKLDLDIEISDLQALDKLKVSLMKDGSVSAKIVSASSKNGKVEGRLELKING